MSTIYKYKEYDWVIIDKLKSENEKIIYKAQCYAYNYIYKYTTEILVEMFLQENTISTFLDKKAVENSLSLWF